MKLSGEEIERYNRQIKMKVWGLEGQLKIKRAKALVAGVGGLGCSIALALVSIGFGKVVLVDYERVELSNLSRQVLYSTRDIGKLKVRVAAERLRELNPSVEIEALSERITEENAVDLVKGVDLVLDGQDNFESRYALNRACISLGVPFIHGAVYGVEGRVMTVLPRKTACLRCLHPVAPEAKEIVPVTIPTVSITASIQVMEAIKLVIGFGDLIVNKVLIIDLESNSFDYIPVERKRDCIDCGG